MIDSKKLQKTRIWSDAPKRGIEEFERLESKDLKRVTLSSSHNAKRNNKTRNS